MTGELYAVCGVSYDHDWQPGDLECRECHADLGHWNDDYEEEDDEQL